MRRFLLAILSVFAAARVFSADPLVAPLTPDCRYLFIVDTSLSMTRLQDSIATSVSRMIATGLDGQMGPGEVFTIWTFNEDVQQREFPLTSWSPERGQAMSARVGEFLRSRRYRRNANMRALINAVYQAKRLCPRLAVLLINNGEQVLVGTPFDRNINVSYGRRFEELRSARVPFLTSLLCRNGEIVAWSTIAANEPLDLPVGTDGRPIVGRRRQPMSVNPAPVPADDRAPVLGPVANALTLMEPEPPRPEPREAEAAVRTQPLVTKVNGREVVNLTPAEDPDAPRVVRPTDVAPAPKMEMPKLPFTKTEPPADTNEVRTAGKPVTGAKPKPEPVAEAAVEIADAATKAPEKMPVTPVPKSAVTAPSVSTNELVSVKPTITQPQNPNRAPDVVLAAMSQAAKATGTNATAPATRVVIITQLVNVAWPQMRTGKPKNEAPVKTNSTPKPEPSPETRPTEPAKRVAEKKPDSEPDTKAVETKAVEATPAPVKTGSSAESSVGDDPPSFVSNPVRSGGASTNFAGAPVAPRPAVNEDTGGTLAVGSGSRVPVQWIYLGAAVVLLALAGLTGWKLLTPPIDASLISQSMEDRDNG